MTTMFPPTANTYDEPRRLTIPQLRAYPSTVYSVTFEWPISTAPDGTELVLQLDCVHEGKGESAYVRNARRGPDGSLAMGERYPVLSKASIGSINQTIFDKFVESAFAELHVRFDEPRSRALRRGECIENPRTLKSILSDADRTPADVSKDPTIIRHPVWGGPQGRRDVVLRWSVAIDGDGNGIYVDLSCHDLHGSYVAYVNNMVQMPNGYTTWISAPLAAHLLVSEASEYYDERDLKAFVARALASFDNGTTRSEVASYLRGEHAMTLGTGAAPARDRKYDAQLTPSDLERVTQTASVPYRLDARHPTWTQDVFVFLAPGVSVTLATLLAVERWAATSGDIRLLIDDRMLIAYQGNRIKAWDTDGSPASPAYLRACPLDR